MGLSNRLCLKNGVEQQAMFMNGVKQRCVINVANVSGLTILVFGFFQRVCSQITAVIRRGTYIRFSDEHSYC